MKGTVRAIAWLFAWWFALVGLPRLISQSSDANSGVLVNRQPGSLASFLASPLASTLSALSTPTTPGVWYSVLPVFSGPVYQMVVDRAGTVYCIAGNSLFKSTNQGQSWFSATGDLPAVIFRTVAVDPITIGTVYLGTDQTIFKSVDGGSHWLQLNLPLGTSINQIAVGQGNSGYVYAATNGSFVYWSGDRGNTWTQSSSGLSGGQGPQYTTTVAVDPTNYLRVYTATSRGFIFRSDNGGSSWSVIGDGQNYWISQIAISPTSPNVVWAVNDAIGTSFNNILVSTNFGDTWSGAGNPAGRQDHGTIAIDPTNATIAYAATAQGLFKTTGNKIWSLLFSPPVGPAQIGAVAIDPSRAGQFYAGSTFSGAYASVNSGSSWQQVNSGIAAAAIPAIRIAPSSSSTVYAAAQGVGLLKSVDAGKTWSSIGTLANLQNQYLGGLAVNPTNPNQLLMSASAANLLCSSDGGVSFSSVAPYNPEWIGFSPLMPSAALASIQDSQGGSLFSGNVCASWQTPQNLGATPTNYAFHPSSANVVFTVANQYTGAAIDTAYVMWSNSGGNGGWVQSTPVGQGTLMDLALDQGDPTTLYAVGSLRSENTFGIYKFKVSYNGLSVTEVTRVAGTFNNGLFGATPQRILYNAPTATLYITTNNGVFQSTDQAETWAAVGTGLGYLPASSLSATPDGRHLLVGTQGGIWKYSSVFVSSVSPASATAGTGGFTLTVNGSNFANGDIILWNGLNLITTQVNSSQLTASVPASNIAAAGTASIAVLTDSGLTNFAPFTINQININQGGVIPLTGPTHSKVGAFSAGYWVRDLNGNFAWDGTPTDGFTFWSLGRTDEIPVYGDWNGDGRTKIGVYADGTWLLDYNGNGVWDGPNVDKLIYFGGPGYAPYVGDWNGSGTSKIAVYQNGTWLIDYNGNFAWDGPAIDKLSYLGGPGYIPIVGDWNGSGTTKIGVHLDGTWLLDYNGNFVWDGTPEDKLFLFGGPGDTPVVGDWNGSGTSKVGAYLNGQWVLDYNGNFVWDGTSVDRVTFFGGPGYTPVVGDWNGDGTTKVGAYLDRQWVLDINGNFIWDPPTDLAIFFGGPGLTPIVGKW